MSLHVLRRFHRLHFVKCQVINVTAMKVVPVLTEVLCVVCVSECVESLTCIHLWGRHWRWNSKIGLVAPLWWFVRQWQ